MDKQKKVTPIGPSKRKPVTDSQVHVVSSGYKSKKAPSGCGSCGKRRIK
ncbi:hypothetical protein AWH56_015845 [Anaerobacillus isosaccharinicus]|uniref:Uncharacterized protein n=1 Tax=Anaerobacillus isosaccharinicus TaxID=1532552 RepID=A0A7S7L4E1_9BACI|nr:hypothetical protein [Anaerobacillus isosaccharinicus]MBA5587626.1 hypothetical protein [Anaerobacillus isosaccharinicus]QOY34198.1 hypothetical protein AWH56_015845 [Anaerobacillus isosaccharinicus]